MTTRCPHCGGPVPLDGARPHQPLTQKQGAFYRFLAEYAERNGYAPSFDEIAEHFGYRSLATVHEHLGNIERKGWIIRQFNESRGITCLVAVDEIGAVAVHGTQ